MDRGVQLESGKPVNLFINLFNLFLCIRIFFLFWSTLYAILLASRKEAEEEILFLDREIQLESGKPV